MVRDEGSNIRHQEYVNNSREYARARQFHDLHWSPCFNIRRSTSANGIPVPCSSQIVNVENGILATLWLPSNSHRETLSLAHLILFYPPLQILIIR